MNSDDGMDSFNGLSSGDLDFASTGEGLVETGVDCVEGFKVFLVWSREG